MDPTAAGFDPAQARRSFGDIGAAPGRPALFAKLSPLDRDGALDEVRALANTPLDGVLLPGVVSGADLQHVGALLAVFEADTGRQDGSLGVVPVLDRGASFLALATFRNASARLRAIAWDGEALAADLGAVSPRDPDGRWIEPCAVARFQTLATATAAGVPAIDAPFTAGGAEAFQSEAASARADGFSAKFALDEAQATVIADVFG